MATRKARAPRQWARDEDKERFWRQKVAEWHASGLSVRAFCLKQQLPQSSFNAWRRELVIRDREAGIGIGTGVTPALPPTVKDSRGRVIPAKFRELCSAVGGEQAPFIPLKVVPDSADQKAVPPKAVSVEIRSPKGFSVRLDCETDAHFIAGLIRSLEGN